MIRDDAFRILEIEPTNDKKKIKKAYAGLVKKYHPEEFPERWKRIHEAYESAIEQAGRLNGNTAKNNALTLEKVTLAMAAKNTAADEESRKQKEEEERKERIRRQREIRQEERKQEYLDEESRKQKEEEERKERIRRQREMRQEERKQEYLDEESRKQKEEEERKERIRRQREMRREEQRQRYLDEEEDIFENFDDLVEAERKQQYEDNFRLLESAIREMESLGTDYEGWKAFFGNEVYAEIFVRQKFIVKLGEIAQGKWFNKKLYELMKNELQLIRQYLPLVHNVWGQITTEKEIARTEKEVYFAYRRYQERKPSGGMVFIFLLLAIFFIVFMSNLNVQNFVQKKKQPAEEKIENTLKETPEPVDTSAKSSTEEKDKDGAEQSAQAGDEKDARLPDPMEEVQKNTNRDAAVLLSWLSKQEEKELADMAMPRDGLYIMSWWDFSAMLVPEVDKKEEEWVIDEIPFPEQVKEVLGDSAADDETHTFVISSDGYKIKMSVFLFCDFDALGMADESRVFYYDGAQYVEILPAEGTTEGIPQTPVERQRYKIDDFWAFVVDVSSDKEYPIVFVYGE